MRISFPSVLLAGILFYACAQGAAQPIQEKPMISRFTVELPNLQCPISLIIDDPSPILADHISTAELEKR